MCLDSGSYGFIYRQGKGRQERDTQQENSNTKLAAHKYNACNSNAS